jgi:hypothetical protein
VTVAALNTLVAMQLVAMQLVAMQLVAMQWARYQVLSEYGRLFSINKKL